MMGVNANFKNRVLVNSTEMDWLDSPMQGVQRRLLDRVGEEVARATSIVRYAPGSHFSPHEHTGGEEFLVLEGVFQDEQGDFPAGSYIRNPPGSRHTPGSEAGCTIFVKLWQFEPEDRTHVRLQTDHMTARPHDQCEGVSVLPLHQDSHETVTILVLEPGAELKVSSLNGAELLVLQGSIVEQDDTLVPGCWLRLPVDSPLSLKATASGTRIWLKTGHLSDVETQIRRLTQHGL